jgi:hypothetical protein
MIVSFSLDYRGAQKTAAGSDLRGRRLPQSDVKLMTQKKVLGFKQAPRLEQIGDKHSERVQDRKHRIR